MQQKQKLVRVIFPYTQGIPPLRTYLDWLVGIGTRVLERDRSKGRIHTWAKCSLVTFSDILFYGIWLDKSLFPSFEGGR
jgi:hypothetical protein